MQTSLMMVFLHAPRSPADPSPKRPAPRSLSSPTPKRPVPPAIKIEHVTVSGDGSPGLRVAGGSPDAGGSGSSGAGVSRSRLPTSVVFGGRGSARPTQPTQREQIERGLRRVLGTDSEDSESEGPLPVGEEDVFRVRNFAPSTSGLKSDADDDGDLEPDDETLDVVSLGVQAVPPFTEIFDVGVQTEPLRLSRDEIRGALKEIAVGDSMIGAAMMLLVERVLQDGARPP